MGPHMDPMMIGTISGPLNSLSLSLLRFLNVVHYGVHLLVGVFFFFNKK